MSRPSLYCASQSDVRRLSRQAAGTLRLGCRIKSGTYNTLPLQTTSAKPETVDGYEIGFKGAFFNRRLCVNLAVFQNTGKNPQVLAIIPANGGLIPFIGLTNAQKARVRGAEGDLQFELIHGLTLRGGATYLDARDLKFTNAPFNDAPIDPATGQYVSPYGLLAQRLGDASGFRMAQVPKWRVTGVDYSIDTGVGSFVADASLSFTPRDSKGMVRVWGKNVNGAKYYLAHNPVNGGNGDISGAAPPRTFGVEFGVRL